MKRWPDRPVFQYHLFCALTALGDYDKAAGLFQQIIQFRAYRPERSSGSGR